MEKWHGAEIQVVIEGNWTTYRVWFFAAFCCVQTFVFVLKILMSAQMSDRVIVTRQSKILHYMRQMAVITPYAQFIFKFISDAPE